jgi:hypothetical protein
MGRMNWTQGSPLLHGGGYIPFFLLIHTFETHLSGALGALGSCMTPPWVSFTQDFLAIMALSVSSEQVFSAAGIAIPKHRNSLKADIVKALQILKSLINSDLIFHDRP